MSRCENRGGDGHFSRSSEQELRAAAAAALLFTCNLETLAIERKIGSFSRGEKSSLPPGDETVPVSHA